MHVLIPTRLSPLASLVTGKGAQLVTLHELVAAATRLQLENVTNYYLAWYNLRFQILRNV